MEQRIQFWIEAIKATRIVWGFLSMTRLFLFFIISAALGCLCLVKSPFLLPVIVVIQFKIGKLISNDLDTKSIDYRSLLPPHVPSEQRPFFCDSFQDWKINFRWPRYKINRGRCFLHMCLPNKDLLVLFWSNSWLEN